MFDIAPSELMVVALVAIVLIGPKDLPRVMRVVGLWVGRGRAMIRNVHGVVDDMIREAELQETAEQWKAQNAGIVRERIEPPAVQAAADPQGGIGARTVESLTPAPHRT